MTDTTLSRFSRTALIVTALLAVTAVGTRFWADRAPPPVAAGQAQPDVGAMIAELQARLKDSPNDAEGWRLLGWTLFETQRFAEAATAYGRAAKLKPAESSHWSSLGESLVMAGPGNVSPNAKAAFEKAIAIDPKDPRSRYFLAVAKDMAGDHRGALDAWFALLNDSPPGAPWEADVRRTIEQVGTKNKIDVTARLAALRPAAGPVGVPAPSAAQVSEIAAMPPAAQQQMIAGMVDKLAAKLKAEPRNVEGWIMLMRSRAQLGQKAEARAAFVSAKAANPGAAAQLDSTAKELGI